MMRFGSKELQYVQFLNGNEHSTSVRNVARAMKRYFVFWFVFLSFDD